MYTKEYTFGKEVQNQRGRYKGRFAVEISELDPGVCREFAMEAG